MQIAQHLYEGIETENGSLALITYMRTDSVRIAKEAQDAALKLIRETYGEQYAPAKPNFYKSKANAQDAHEAICPWTKNTPSAPSTSTSGRNRWKSCWINSITGFTS